MTNHVGRFEQSKIYEKLRFTNENIDTHQLKKHSADFDFIKLILSIDPVPSCGDRNERYKYINNTVAKALRYYVKFGDEKQQFINLCKFDHDNDTSFVYPFINIYKKLSLDVKNDCSVMAEFIKSIGCDALAHFEDAFITKDHALLAIDHIEDDFYNLKKIPIDILVDDDVLKCILDKADVDSNSPKSREAVSSFIYEYSQYLKNEDLAVKICTHAVNDVCINNIEVKHKNYDFLKKCLEVKKGVLYTTLSNSLGKDFDLNDEKTILLQLIKSFGVGITFLQFANKNILCDDDIFNAVFIDFVDKNKERYLKVQNYNATYLPAEKLFSNENIDLAIKIFKSLLLWRFANNPLKRCCKDIKSKDLVLRLIKSSSNFYITCFSLQFQKDRDIWIEFLSLYGAGDEHHMIGKQLLNEMQKFSDLSTEQFVAKLKNEKLLEKTNSNVHDKPEKAKVKI